MEALSSHSKGLIQLIRTLETLGIANAVPSLPKFAVIGALACRAATGHVQDARSASRRSRLMTKRPGAARCLSTKPDLFPNESVEQISKLKAIINGEDFVLGKGWYVTKQLSKSEVDKGVAYCEARARERKFFATQPPWSSMLASLAERCGIPTLQDMISKEYHRHIVENVTEIRDRIITGLEEVESKLENFPPAEEDTPSCIVWDEIDRLSGMIIQDLHGEGLGSPFRTQYKSKLQALRAAPVRARPDVRYIEAKRSTSKFSNDNDDAEIASSLDTGARASKSRKGSKGQGIKTSVVKRLSRRGRSRNSLPEKDIADNLRATFDLMEVKKWCRDGSASMLPNQPNPKITDSLVLRSLEGWPLLVDRTLEKLHEGSQKLLDARIKEALTRRLHAKLYTESQKTIDDLFASLMSQAKAFIDTMVKGEMHKPATFDEAKLHDIKTTEMSRLSKQSAGCENKDFVHEIEAVATALAYYEIASGNIVDYIGKHLEYAVLSKFEMDLRSALRKGLEVGNVEHCGELLKENPEREEERLRLEGEVEKLEQALHELDALNPRD